MTFAKPDFRACLLSALRIFPEDVLNRTCGVAAHLEANRAIAGGGPRVWMGRLARDELPKIIVEAFRGFAGLAG
jgi:hypothetical protein